MQRSEGGANGKRETESCSSFDGVFPVLSVRSHVAKLSTSIELLGCWYLHKVLSILNQNWSLVS